MASGTSTLLLRSLAGWNEASEPNDRELLERFSAGESGAFATLICRHGGMVFGLCRRILEQEQDAEDVFQAVFLLLSSKAASLQRKEAVGPWLYGVTHRLALRARQKSRTRRTHEERAPSRNEYCPVEELTLREAQSVVDEELARVPERERGPLILCYLEGMTCEQAAQRLGCPLGTLKSRLERGRALLQKRLARRGFGKPACFATLLVGREATAIADSLHSKTLEAVLGYSRTGTIASPAVAGLLRTSPIVRTAIGILVLSLVGILVARAALPRDETPPSEAPPPAMISEAAAAEEPKEIPDWPQWRGANRDGIVRGIPIPDKWPQNLKEEWKVEIGHGVASPVMVGGKVYLLARNRNQEFLTCVDAASGQEIWKSVPYAAQYKDGPGEGNAMNWPRSTPAVADGKVYTLGNCGTVSCFDAAKGNVIWRKETAWTYYGGTSPLVTDGMCIVLVGDGKKIGGLTAFDAKTGDQRWCLSSDVMSGSPILVDMAGERQIISYRHWNPVGVSLSGKALWSTGPGGGGQPCTTSLQYKDLLIVTDNMASPRALRLKNSPNGLVAEEVWQSDRNLKHYYSSPVAAEGRVFGHSTHNGGSFYCLDANTGKTIWESEIRQGGYASALHLRKVVLFLTDRGKLVVVNATAAKYEPLAEYKVSDVMTEAHPLFLGNRILVKDSTTLRSFKLE